MSDKVERISHTFGDRFSFARWWKALVSGSESDKALAEVVGRSSTVIGDYMRSESLVAPNSDIWPEVSAHLHVDPSWLRKADPPPVDWVDRDIFLSLFSRWAKTRARVRAISASEFGGADYARDRLAPKVETEPASELLKRKAPAKKASAKKRAG